MEYPFPGMDPFLEAPNLWPDVHNSLIFAIRDQIQRQLNPNYVAVITPYITYESLQIAPNRGGIVPDVGILEPTPPITASVSIAPVAPAPLTLPAEMAVETRYARLELRSVDDETLITAIEVLSPVNKRAGSTKPSGAGVYQEKREKLFWSNAHLLEIDLLRNGVRPPLAYPLPDKPYFIFLSRAERRPNVDIWPTTLQEPLPVVPVPLRHPDPDVTLDIGAALRQIYASARYERRIDYRMDPPSPVLSEEDTTWLEARLQEVGLRP
ncbi:MAG: DUF4058 family protein [Chloroflexota bacterium]